MPAETTKRFVCIHGHFYQPPRENPWLETIETQDSAAPYHDWNERICSECYATNGAARVVNNENQITRIVNNYARISFNVGATLLTWLERHDPDTYAGILEADRQSQERFSGHGSALAQVYNHAIMPLANRRDKVTQIRWGKADILNPTDRFAPQVTSVVAGALWEWPPAVCGHQHDPVSLRRAKSWSAASYDVFTDLARDPATGVYLRVVNFYFKRPIDEEGHHREKLAELPVQVRDFLRDAALIRENGISPDSLPVQPVATPLASSL